MLECNYTAIVAACKWYPVSMLELLEPLLVNMHPNRLVLIKNWGQSFCHQNFPFSMQKGEARPWLQLMTLAVSGIDAQNCAHLRM